MTFTRETPRSLPDRFLRGTLRIGSTCTAALFGLLLGLSQTPAAAQEGAYEVVDFEGTVVPAREADITPIVSGWLRHIAFVPGQIVDEGDVLFEFAMPPAQYRLDLAQAQQDAAQAQLQEAIAEVKRAELLKDRDVVSEVELEKNIALRDIAAANLAAAEANVGLAGLGVMQMTQKAPFAGMMSAPMVRENGWQDVGDGDITMAIITQLDPIQVVGEVPYDVYAARQKMFGSDQELIDGIALSLILPGGEVYPHEGRLVSGGHKFEAESQKMTVWVEFPNPELLLRPGLKVAIQSRVKP